MKKLFKAAIFVLVVVGIIKAIPYVTDYLFPSTYERQIEKCAEEFGVDKNLIMAIIKAESNFRKDAVSAKGAKGLMQIMDETGKWCADKIGISDPDLGDVETNIRIGTFYVSHLIKMYDGNTETAIAAYNAGFGNVDKWLKDETLSSDGKNLSQIPFEETNKYIKKVMLYKKVYNFKDKKTE